MSKIYFTITGTKYRYGSDFFEKGDKVKLVKEPDNQYDREAIRVEVEGLGLVGYVANSVPTVLGESYSAGRIYDRIGDIAFGKVMIVLPQGVICRLREKDIIPTMDEFYEELSGEFDDLDDYDDFDDDDDDSEDVDDAEDSDDEDESDASNSSIHKDYRDSLDDAYETKLHKALKEYGKKKAKRDYYDTNPMIDILKNTAIGDCGMDGGE